ncbi:molybdopterin guanine dinucleotide-containing S/N-oxide reductase [Helicobacter sp. MIT 03-1614]|uniref:molybdopterin guanine dinucleotide-containing S/N-oxide reductase n=1 Tax=Helicobacter sp. MIT 03-1614 TaxID=1548147 RepID=UPI000513BEC8|nr:molybdopterin guanine dinucleotide-containing S/N-oxide reductase [Helicobacter sp. MIT 03-1614]TLD90355.1 molybdopterin guanine dinucleotide-containing S/N-oxide reductase [Helicobacter sp. MIT 03-1614]
MNVLSRRQVLQAMGKGLAVFALVPFVGCDTESKKAVIESGVKSFSENLVLDGEVITGAHWGVLKAKIKDGKVISSTNALKNNVSNPLHSTIPDLIYSPTRIQYPMVRKSYLENPANPKPELRGADEWVRVSYDEAIALIAKELKATYKQKGKEGVFAGSYGWKSSGNLHNARILLQRFMGMAGGYVGVSGDYSTGASQVIMPYVVGSIEVYEQQTSFSSVLDNSQVVVIWGADPMATLRNAWTLNEGTGLDFFEQLKKSGKHIISIDPVRNMTCDYLGAEWLAPLPNTDVALMLGIMHTMFKSNQYDKEFLENYTTGFEQFKSYLLGEADGIAKDALWASKICGISAQKIESLAQLFFNNRTMLMSGWGMQRAHHGEQPHWSLVTLACMIGQIGLPGGGFGLSYHYSNGGSPTATAPVVGGINLGNVGSGGAEWLMQGSDNNFPLARISDALLNPGKSIEHNGKKITYTDIDFIYWAGGNPLVHHQDTNTLIKAWQKPRTIVVNEIYWTPTARFADIVMPITTSYERNDISMSGDYSNLHIVPMKQLVEKQFEARDDYQVFCDLAKAFGVYDTFNEGKNEMQWIEEFYNQALKQAEGLMLTMPSFKEFWEANEPLRFEIPAESESFVRYAEFREDPILNPLGTESGLIEIYSKSIEKFGYTQCPPHPTWLEPIEWLGMDNKPAEFALITSHPELRLHSQCANTSLRKDYAIADKEPIWINTKDAADKGIKTGDIVSVSNQRGEVLAGAFVTDAIKQGVVRLCEGAWYDPQEPGKIGSVCKNGSSNVLTLDMPTSPLANGNIAHTALVNIKKYEGEVKPLSVFESPQGA